MPTMDAGRPMVSMGDNTRNRCMYITYYYYYAHSIYIHAAYIVRR